MKSINSPALHEAAQTRPGSIPVSGGASRDWGALGPGNKHTYYGLPLINRAGWRWQIILYFFLGGIAGGSYLVATLAHLFDKKKYRELIRAGRYLSFACVVASPILLIWDLGRPERFHHMLRIFKLRSVMSLGTWALSSFGLFCGLTATHQAAQDGLLRWFPGLTKLLKALPIRLIELPGVFTGLFVASYTGVLLSSTAVPLWGRSRHLLGPLFLTSGLSTGLASLSLLLSMGRHNQATLEHLERAELVAMTTELGLIAAIPATTKELGKPLFTGKVGTLFTAGTIGSSLVLPLLLRLTWRLRKKATPRSLNAFLSLLVLGGGLILRYAWIVAGRASADDPQAVHYYNALESKPKTSGSQEVINHAGANNRAPTG